MRATKLGPSNAEGVARVSEATPGGPRPRIARCSCGLRSGPVQRRGCSPDERSDIRGTKAPHIASLMRATKLGPSNVEGVARVSEATPGDQGPAYRVAHAGYEAAPSNAEGVARMSAATSGGSKVPHSPLLMRATKRPRPTPRV